MTLIDLAHAEVSGGAVAGWSQPWAPIPNLAVVRGALEKPEDSDNVERLLTHDATGVVSDIEVTALTRANRTVNLFNVFGRNRTLALRASGSGAQRNAILCQVRTTADRLYLSIQQVSGGSTTTLGEVLMGDGWNPRYASYPMRHRVRVDGTTVRAKVWMDRQPEPEEWMIERETTVTSAGAVGLLYQGQALNAYVWVGIDPTEAPSGASDGVPLGEANYSSIASLAVTCSMPLVGGGLDPNTEIGSRDDVDIVPLAMREARYRAMMIALSNPRYDPPPTDGPLGYSHCSRYAGTVMLTTVDPYFPGDSTEWQYNYMMDPANGWDRIGVTEDWNPESYLPGDIFVTREMGHVFIWIGEYGGYDDVISEASWKGAGNPTSRVAGLNRAYISGGTDPSGRAYDGFRWRGRGHRVEVQMSDLTGRDAWLQTATQLIRVEPRLVRAP